MNAPTRFKKKLLASLITASVITLATAPSVSWGQSAYATLRGKAPPNTEVTAFNPLTGTTRHATSSADGSYTLTGLQPGTYQVDAGPGTQQTVTLTVASTSSLNLQAAAAAAPASAANATTLNAVSVSASTLQEVKTPEVGGTISLHQIDTIPQVSRNFLEFADTVPGMVFTRDANGNTSLRGGAQNASSSNVYIDGVGQKSYVKEGGVSGQIGSQGNPFPQLAIGEYKVITSNYKAEYDQISSAAVTAQTKSGTNEFHGEAFGRYTNDAFRERTPAEEAADKKTESQEKEYGFAVGGPIIKDKMHFFATYEAKRFNTPVTVVADDNATPGIPLLPADAAAQLGPSNLPFEENLYFGKIDWEPTDRDRFELSAQIRKEKQTGGVGNGTTAASAAYQTKNDDKRYTLRWQHSGESYFNELLVTHEDSFNAPVANNLGNGYIYTYPLPNADPTIVAIGAASPLATQNKGQKGPSIQDDLTFNDLQWYGDHVIKMGVKYKEITLDAADAADINPQFTYDVTRRSRCDSVQGVLHQAGQRPGRTEPDRGDQGQAVGPVRAGRLGGQRQAHAEPGRALGLREKPVLHRLRHAGQRGRCALQPGSERARRADLRPIAGQWRHQRQRLHQQRPQPQEFPRRMAAAAGLLLRHQRRRAARDPWRLRSCLRPQPVRLPAAGNHQGGAAAVHGVLPQSGDRQLPPRLRTQTTATTGIRATSTAWPTCRACCSRAMPAPKSTSSTTS